MIPSAFKFYKPDSIEKAVSIMKDFGDEARVIAFKDDKIIKKKDGTEKVLAKGIYRETIGRGKNKAGLRALFYFGDIPTQKKGGAGQSNMKGRLFPEIVFNFADSQLIKLWLQEIKRLAK